MTAASRRVLLYWLLLLLPTLAAGGGALWLLKREQAHLDEQARAAAQSSHASIEARARLIAENVELLVGDVQTALMATLREVPNAGGNAAADAFLDEWERTNPLVRGTFRLTSEGQISRPAAGSARSAMRAWLRGWLVSEVPWRVTARPQTAESEGERQSRRDVASNVQNVQSARSAIQDVASLKNRMEKTQELQPVERTGWTPWRDGGGLHLIGWRLQASGTIAGVEVELGEIVKRLGDLLPKDGDQAEAFILRESGGATLQLKEYGPVASSADSRKKPAAVTVPVSAGVLPGWEVAGLARDDRSVSAGAGFFVVGALLVVIFVVAIVSGGSLLLWQARRSEAEAAQKTSFVANVSHEFKTPLTTIRLYAELLEQGRVRDASQKDEYLRIIGLETERLARLVNNALDFSRLEQGRKKYARDRINPAAELARLLDTHEPILAEAGLVLHRVLPSENIQVVADRDAIEQIVLNLLDNAAKYAASGNEVTVSLISSAPGAEVRVADRGPGVPVEHRQRIFEKFHRVDDALTADKGGAGLGLSIARQLARGMGGDLRFEARPGGGAEFILKLP